MHASGNGSPDNKYVFHFDDLLSFFVFGIFKTTFTLSTDFERRCVLLKAKLVTLLNQTEIFSLQAYILIHDFHFCLVKLKVGTALLS